MYAPIISGWNGENGKNRLTETKDF